MLELKPWEIDRLTVGEILDMYDGWTIRRRRTEELLATFVTLPIYNHQRSKKDKMITLKDLFGHKDYVRRYGEEDKPTEDELFNDLFNAGGGE